MLPSSTDEAELSLPDDDAPSLLELSYELSLEDEVLSLPELLSLPDE